MIVRAPHAELRHARWTSSAAAGLFVWVGALILWPYADAHAEPIRSVVMRDAGNGSERHDVRAFAAMVDGGSGDIAPTILAMVSGGRPPSPMPSSSAPSSPSSSGGGDLNVIIGPSSEANFARWQKDADEKLKAENEIGKVKQHPLALAHPGKMVVVCEAGCRTPQDEIVYIAVLVPAVLPATPARGSLDATSSGSPTAGQPDDGEVTCIAGCYVRPERTMPAPRRRAELDQQPSQTPAQRYAEIVHDAMHRALAAAPAPDFGAPAGDVETVARRTPIRVATVERTPDRPARPRIAVMERGVNGAIVQVRMPASLQRARIYKSYASGSPRAIKRMPLATVGQWTTTVIPAPSLASRSKSIARTKGLSRVRQAAKLRRTATAAWHVRVVAY